MYIEMELGLYGSNNIGYLHAFLESAGWTGGKLDATKLTVSKLDSSYLNFGEITAGETIVTTTKKSDRESIVVSVTLYAAKTVDTTVPVYFRGGHSDVEDYGVGTHFDLALDGGAEAGETIVNTAYNETLVTCIIPAGQLTREITMTIVDNPTLEWDRVITISSLLFGVPKTVTIVDDNRTHLIDVTSEADMVSVNSHALSTGDDGTNNDTYLNAAMTYFKDNPGSVVFKFPVGTFLMKAVKVPTNTSKLSFVGTKNTYGNVSTGATILKKVTPYLNSSRMFNTTSTGYLYSSNSDSSVNALSFQNLYIDAQINNNGTYWGYQFEQCVPVFVGADVVGKTGKYIWAIEGCTIANSGSAGFQSYSQTVCNAYQISGSDNFKGIFVLAGDGAKLTGRDFSGHASDMDSTTKWQNSGFHIEPNTFVLCNEIQLTNVYCYDGGYVFFGSSHGTVTNLQFMRGLYNEISFSGGKTATLNIIDSTLYNNGDNGHGPFPGNIACNNVNFISFAADGDTGDLFSAPGPLTTYLAEHVLKWTFTDCSFSNEGKVAGSGAYGYQTYGTTSWVTYPDNYVNFIDCVFDESLDGAIRATSGGNAGTVKVTLTRPVFNCSTGGLAKAYCIYVSACYDIDNHDFWLSIDDPVWNITGGKPFYIYGYGTTTIQDHSWLYLNGTIPEAQCGIIKFSSSGITNLCCAKVGAAEISGITVDNPTTINFASAHNITDQEKVVFDGFSEARNAWFYTNLSPRTSSPIFTATVVNPTRITIPIDSTGQTYDATKDYAKGYQYPMRTITSTSATSPDGAAGKAGFVGERYSANGTLYRCVSSGIAETGRWVAEG